MKALVTGGAGFIGSQLADRLVDEGHRVVVIDDLSCGKREYVNPKAAFYQKDIRDPNLAEVFLKEKPDICFHLAAQIDVRVSVARPIHDAEINIHGSLRVMEACVKSGVKKLVFSSSGGAIYHAPEILPTPETAPTTPLSPYGVAKLVFELYLRSASHNYGLKYVALRYANVYGPRQDLKGEAGVIGIFSKKFLAGECPTIYGDGKQTRDFVFVDDVVGANILAMKKDATGVFNIGTGKETSINEIEKMIRSAAGAKMKCARGPAAAGEERRSSLDATAAKKAFGWKPTVPIEEGIKKTVAWFKEKTR